MLANFEVISYDSFIRFWPLFLVGIGLKLIIDHYSGKKS
ncbi:MAG: LiaI-LiaF-like domain-containing protein [Candidatus Saccharicenans sp.]